ncbi:MAG: riboflavin synthase [Thermoanaerobaculia bacterium]|nr:riboflavin synthase [Thermoanaerobaculia bacterium]
MFTGLIRERGRVAADPEGSGQGGVRLQLEHSEDLSEALEIGASLAVSGVCLTITELAAGHSVVELAPETLSRTQLGELRAGDEVNLEPALRVGDALGGHWVQGHVDGTVLVVGRRDLDDHRELTLRLPEAMAHWVAEKGSVTLDGVSLTVAGIDRDTFSVALIPHTLEVTTLGAKKVGARLNLEVDILAKYLQRLVERGRLGVAST